MDSVFQALDSGFQGLDSGFQYWTPDSRYWIMDSREWIPDTLLAALGLRIPTISRDSGFLELYSGFHEQKFPRAKISQIPEYGFPHLGRLSVATRNVVNISNGALYLRENE